MKGFLTGKLNTAGRIMFVLAGIAIGLSLLFSWWSLKLIAPMYPEGLEVNVYADKLGPQEDITILNTLNHYVGMKHLDEADFPELIIIPWVVAAVALLSILTALIRRNWAAVGTLAIFAIGGVIGLTRMYHWLSTFGTTLDPKSAITIEPFVPPILGKNVLAGGTYTTYSNFGIGVYLLLAAMLIMVIVLWKFRQRDPKAPSNKKKPATAGDR